MFKALLFSLCVQIVQHLARLRAEDFKRAVDLVIQAETDEALPTGASKSEWVKAKIKEVARDIAPFVLELLVSLAVGFANKTGAINVRLKPVSLS